MNGLATAVALLTRIPVRGGARHPERAARWVPAAAVVVAAPPALAAWVLGELLPGAPAAALTVAAWVAVTGALHLDGLADCADAAFLPADRARRWEVLADVHHGTFATAAIGLVLLVKFGCLAGMTPATAGASVFAAVVAARGWLPAAAAGAPPLRDSGMGAAFRAGCTRFAVAGGCLAACAGPMAALGWWGAGAAAAGGAAAGLAAWGLRRALGGLNGDGYGACVEIGECAVLAAAAGFGGRLAPWGVFGW